MTPPNDKLPPRAYLRPDHNLGMKRYDAVEYLSLAEHSQILAEKLAGARAEAFEMAMDMLAERLGKMERLDAHDLVVAMDDIVEEAQQSRAGEGKEE